MLEITVQSDYHCKTQHAASRVVFLAKVTLVDQHSELPL